MDVSDMFFQGWGGVARVVVVGTLAYIALVLALRVSGTRTLSKLNAFDLVVTVAMGSILASILLSDGVALVEGITAFALLIALQFAVTALSVRSRRFSKLVRSEPRLVLRDGEPLFESMKDARVTRSELDTVIRQSGYTDEVDVEAVILEADGSFSVIGEDASKARTKRVIAPESAEPSGGVS